MIDFSFIRPYNSLPVLQCPLQMTLSEVQPSTSLSRFKKWSLFLHHWPQTRCSQMATDSLRRQSLVGDILQNFHHLLRIISFAHMNNTLGICNISRRKFRRTASSGLG